MEEGAFPMRKDGPSGPTWGMGRNGVEIYLFIYIYLCLFVLGGGDSLLSILQEDRELGHS